MVKTLPKVLYYATRILMKSIHKSILQEIELSRQAARIRYTETEAPSTLPEQISLYEAMRILNVEELNPEEVEKNYKRLFKINSKAQGGSLYLQSKIYRAKQRIDSELSSVSLKNDYANVSDK